MTKRRALALSALIHAFVCLFVVGPAAADTAWPLKSAAELKSLHGADWTGMLRLTYRHTTDYSEPVSAKTVIGLGHDVIYREEDGRRLVVDFRLGRIFEMDARQQFRNYPVVAGVVLQNWRRTIRPMSRRVDAQFQPVNGLDKRFVRENLAATMNEPFWAASQTHVVLDTDPPAQWETQQVGGTVEFLHDTHTAVKWRPAAQELPPGLENQLFRAFIWLWSGHPDILKALATEGRAPELLAFGLPKTRGFAVETFELEQQEWCAECEPLPATATVRQTADGNAFDTVLMRMMSAATAGGNAPTPKAEYLRRIGDALERGNRLEAWLWQTEYSYQYSTPRTPSALVAEDGSDVRMRMFEQGLQDPDVLSLRDIHPGTNEKLLALRSKIPANAYILDQIWVKNLPDNQILFEGLRTGQPPEEAIAAVTKMLAALPLVPVIYFDIGDLYYKAASPIEAWMAWEIGQAIPGHNASPEIWNKLRVLEEEMRAANPPFF